MKLSFIIRSVYTITSRLNSFIVYLVETCVVFMSAPSPYHQIDRIVTFHRGVVNGLAFYKNYYFVATGAFDSEPLYFVLVSNKKAIAQMVKIVDRVKNGLKR